MKNKLLAILCLCVCLIFSCNIIIAAAEVSVDECEKLIGGIAAYNGVSSDDGGLQKWLDGELTEGAGISSEWYVIALRQYKNSLDFTSYANALENYINTHETKSASTRLRYALALTACGRADSSIIAQTIDSSVGEQGIMSYIFGLHLYNNSALGNNFSVSDIINALLSLRIDDGGWAVTGEYSDVDVTAMALQALAPYYGSDSEISEAIDGALKLLSEKQLDSGGFISYGAENPESISQVITALSSLGISLSDERFVKNNNNLLDALLHFALDNGGFRHGDIDEINQTATVQAFYSLVALWRFENGFSPLYVFDNKTLSEIDTETTVSNSPTADDTTPPSENNDNISSITDTEANDNNLKTENKSLGYKTWACFIIIAAVITTSVVLYICGKRSYKNYIAVIICGIVVAVFVCLTDFYSTDNYYNPDNYEKSNIVGTVTLSVNCNKISSQSDSEYIPEDGVILSPTEFDICQGDTVYTVLTEAARKFNIQLDSSGAVSDSGGTIYIKGIGYLYEFDYGELSGWIYRVNGKSPSVGCGEYSLKDGDIIEWVYSLQFGNDLD